MCCRFYFLIPLLSILMTLPMKHLYCLQIPDITIKGASQVLKELFIWTLWQLLCEGEMFKCWTIKIVISRSITHFSRLTTPVCTEPKLNIFDTFLLIHRSDRVEFFAYLNLEYAFIMLLIKQFCQNFSKYQLTNHFSFCMLFSNIPLLIFLIQSLSLCYYLAILLLF